MRSWSTTITAAAVALAFGAANVVAEAPRAPRPFGGAWEQPAIGQLGPLGTSNSLFLRWLSASSYAPNTGNGSATAGVGADSSKHGIPAYAIAGGAALGLGVFIAAVTGGGSSSDLVTSPSTPSTPSTPTTGGTNGGSNGSNTGGVTPTEGGNGGGTNGGTIGDPPSTTTPEPASMALLASGLAGMGGFQLRRHRKRMQDGE